MKPTFLRWYLYQLHGTVSDPIFAGPVWLGLEMWIGLMLRPNPDYVWKLEKYY